ncbi:MAG TPA: PDZ domain-containing protein [Polyangiales bacterium]|nr:PDZ domain-containing protein [Polyangiales bacterium]
MSFSLRAEALSPERVRACVDAEVSRLVRGHAVFRGDGELRFAAADGSRVAARMESVSIEWLGDSELRAEGEGVVRGLGFAVVEAGGEVGALRVAAVDAGGMAARAGMQVGDWIDDAAGLPVRSVADLVPPSAASSLTLGLRDELGARRTIDLRLVRAFAWDGFGYLSWVCPAALALLFFGPWRTPGQLFVRAREQLRGARWELFGASGWLERSFLIVACAAVCCLAAWPGFGLTLGAALAGYLALLVLSALRGRLAWASLGFAGPLVFVLGASAVLSGEAALAADASAAPWGWSLLARPPLWFGAWIWAQCAARLHANDDDFSRLALALITASLWLGGPGTWSPQLSAASQLGLGSALLALKTLSVLSLLALLPRWPQRSLLQPTAWFLAATALWLWLAPSRALELRIGAAVLATSLLAVLGIVLELRGSDWWLRARRQRGQEVREGARAADAEGFEAEAG